MNFAVVDRADQKIVGIRLSYLHPVGTDGADAFEERVRIIGALEGHGDVRFVHQLLCNPDTERPEVGKLEVSLLCVTPSSTTMASLTDLLDDLLDLTSVPPRRWSFDLIDDEYELERLVDPIDDVHVAEIARREDSWSDSASTAAPAGFLADPYEADNDDKAWTLWGLGNDPAQVGASSLKLASALLAQEHPVCIRTIFQSTSMTTAERRSLEEMVAASTVPNQGATKVASLHSLEQLLFVQPMFEARLVVSSPHQISPSLLSSLGWAVSEPVPAAPATVAILAGGYDAIRPASGQSTDIVLHESFDQLIPGSPLPSIAPPRLARLRRLLGCWELANLVLLPVASSKSFPGVEVLRSPDIPTPSTTFDQAGISLGTVANSQPTQPVTIATRDRFRHAYIVGQTGTGKSTLLLNKLVQDMRNGSGVGLIDPHGDLVEAVLRHVPADRHDDVVLIDAADDQAIVGLNLLEAENDAERQFLLSELVAMMYALFDPHRQGIVGPRFENMLRNAASLLINDPLSRGSFIDIPLVFSDTAMRDELLEVTTDPFVRAFFKVDDRSQNARDYGEVVAWFASKWAPFQQSRPVRNLAGQSHSTVNFRDVMNDGKIVLVNLAKGSIGGYNSKLLGYVAFLKFWSAALSRTALRADERRDFFLYVDEFQNFTSDSLPEILAEARKFRLGITLANQFFDQVDPKVQQAILGNVGSIVSLRVGPKDAASFAGWFGSSITPESLVSMPNFTAIGQLSVDGIPIDPVAFETAPEAAATNDQSTVESIRDESRSRYARPHADIEREIFGRWNGESAAPTGADESIVSDLYSSIAAHVLREHIEVLLAKDAHEVLTPEKRDIILGLIQSLDVLGAGDLSSDFLGRLIVELSAAAESEKRMQEPQ